VALINVAQLWGEYRKSVLVFLQHLDHQLFFALNHGLSTPVLDYVMWTVSTLGNSTGLLVGAALGLWLCDRHAFKQHYVWLVLAVVMGFLVVQGLKYGLARPRPLSAFAALMQAGEVHVNIIGHRLHNRSFPSGHAQAAASVFTYLLCLYPQRWLWWSMGTLTAGLARVYLGAHFPSDVLVGMGIGCLSALGALRLQRWRMGCYRVDKPPQSL
jgi:membrane-associated phospholipid phosphatase